MPKNKIEIKTTIESCHHCPMRARLWTKKATKE